MVDQNSQFYAILTNVGAAKQANADALGIPWTITHMGVGDANGTDPTPNATQTKLINEWRRAPLNQLKVDDKNSAIIVAEQVIPAEVGGKWIREIGLYDANGDMVAVANCAPTYKPLLSQGSGRTQVVRMSLVVSSASNVQLKIDPAVVLATREWVTEELARQDFKHSVLVATTTGINLTGLQTIDGVALTAGARVLVKNQVSAKENGIYTVAAGAWKRAPDADSSAKVTPGLLVLVESGTVNGDSAWQLVTDAPITLGVTALSFDMAFGRTGIAVGTYRSVQVDKYGRVVAATNPTTASGYGLTDVYTKSETYNRSEIAKAILDAVTSAVNGLVDSAPGALDTLKELAAAIGNDPNFATSMVNELAKKAPLLSPKFTGAPEAPTPSASSTGLQVANMSALATAIAASSRQFKTAVIGLSTNTTLTAAQMGNAVQFNSGPLTLTLPALADVGNGASVMLRNPSATATQTIVVASSGSIVDGGSTSGSLALKPFEWAELASSGSAWFVVGRGKLKEVAQIDSPSFSGSPTAPTLGATDVSNGLATMSAARSILAYFGLGSTEPGKGLPGSVADVAKLPAGNYYYPPAISPYGDFAFVQRMVFAGNKGFEIGNIPYTDRFLGRASNQDGTWRDPVELARKDSPAFTGTPTAPTQPLGNNTDRLATMAALFQAVNTYKRNYTGNVMQVGANITLQGTQTGYAFNVTAPVTITLPSAEEAGAGGTFVIRNVSPGVVTITTAISQLFERNSGASSMTMQPGEWLELQASRSSYVVNQRGILDEIGKTVADALAAVGLGTQVAPLCGDCNAQATSGFFFVSSSQTTNLPFQSNGFLLQCPWNGNSAALQIYAAASVDKLMYRTKSSGAWRAWKELPSLDGVLGAINNNSRSFRTQAAVGISANITLNTSTHLGALFQFNADALTATLPSSASVPDGSVVTLRNPRVSTQTLAVSAGAIVEEGVAAAKMTLRAYEWAEFTSSATEWFVSARGKLKEAATVEYVQDIYAPLKDPVFSGKPSVPTQKANDASKSVANTEYVEQAKRSFSGPVLGLSSSMTLSAAQSGRLYQANANNLTVTLPAPADAPSGTTYAFRNPSGGTLSITTASGTIAAGVALTTLVLQSGEYVEMVNNTSTGWFVSSRGKLAETPTVDAMKAADAAAIATAAPPGQVAFFARSAPPAGWLKRNGAAYSRTAYADLFAVIGTSFGAGDGSTTFNVPDDRELIDRAWTDGLNAADAGRALFSTQAGQNQAHTHTGTTNSAGAHQHTTQFIRERIGSGFVEEGGNAVLGDQLSDGIQTMTSSVSGAHAHTLSISSTGGNETRMANRAYLACIKY